MIRTLAFCFALGSGGDAAPEDASSLEPLPEQEWTLETARHLLDRAGFGGTPEEIEALAARGLDGAVDWLLAAPAPEGAGAFDAVPLERDPARRRELQELPEEERKARVKELREQERAQVESYRTFWLGQMIEGGAPLREKMALLWHGWFTSSIREVKNGYAMARQIELYRRAGLGSFRSLLHAASKEPAMLVYLNNDKNNKDAPNENFAREVMELFTLGPGNYTERDIHEAARAFTGWKTDGVEFRFAKKQHDSATKSVLGRTGDLDGDDVLDALLEQEAAPRFVANKLFAFFAHSEPEPALEAALAAELARADYELRPFLRTLFRSRAFYARPARGAQVKSPVEFVVSTVRRLGAAPPPGVFLAQACEQLGQALLAPPSVKGWDGGESWISSSTILLRSNLARVLVHGVDRPGRATRAAAKAEGLKRAALARIYKELKGYEPALDVRALAGGARTARGVAIALCDRFLAVAPAEATVDELMRCIAPFGDDGFDPDAKEAADLVRDAVHVVLSLPEYQLN